MTPGKHRAGFSVPFVQLMLLTAQEKPPDCVVKTRSVSSVCGEVSSWIFSDSWEAAFY